MITAAPPYFLGFSHPQLRPIAPLHTPHLITTTPRQKIAILTSNLCGRNMTRSSTSWTAPSGELSLQKNNDDPPIHHPGVCCPNFAHAHRPTKYLAFNGMYSLHKGLYSPICPKSSIIGIQNVICVELILPPPLCHASPRPSTPTPRLLMCNISCQISIPLHSTSNIHRIVPALLPPSTILQQYCLMSTTTTHHRSAPILSCVAPPQPQQVITLL